MTCPTESHRLEEFTKKSNYENSDTPIYRPNGVKIIKAVKLYSSNQKKQTKMKLEKLLGQSVNEIGFIDSAWGCDEDYCHCEKVTKSETKHETYRGDICTCDKVKCSCDNVRHCQCTDHCYCEGM